MPIIEINGKKVEAEAGSMVIEVADNVGIQIPRFCYHKKLSIAANCRMCLVEVEKAPKPLPACATPVTEGMKIWTRSPKALLAQKAVMEFLLINHPLDCPICDQGGECELQDLSMGYGNDGSRYTEGKRVVSDKDIGPLIATDLTRCIQCTRCVRFGTEVAGYRELGATGRGECMEIGTFIEKNVNSEVSGNVIDLCPVGALTSKPFRFSARGWELTQIASIAPHDCVGSNIYLHQRRNEVMRVVPRENEEVNEVWLSDRDRFSYEGLYNKERLINPKIKNNNNWKTVSWEDALEYTSQELLANISRYGKENLAGLISPNSTVEECYLFQKLLRGFGSNHIDHRLRQQDFRSQEEVSSLPTLGMTIKEIEQQKTILLLGSDIRKEQPILGIKLRKMTLSGGKVLAINPIDFPLNFMVHEKNIPIDGDIYKSILGLTKAILQQKNINVPAHLKELESVRTCEIDQKLAAYFLEEEQKLILLGSYALSHPNFSSIHTLIGYITELTNAKWCILSDGANSMGAWKTGCVPHCLPMGVKVNEKGLNIEEMFNFKLKIYILYNFEPDLDCLNAVNALKALRNADLVVVITSFASKALEEIADILLPMAPFTETSGTYINIEERWQSLKPVTLPLGESRPGWKILRVLANLCDLPDFEYESTEFILKELQEKNSYVITKANNVLYKNNWPELKGKQVMRLGSVPLYAADSLVRRANALQNTSDAKNRAIRLNSKLVQKFQLIGKKAKVIGSGFQVTLPYEIDEGIPENCVWIPMGIKETVSLGGPYSIVEIQGVEE